MSNANNVNIINAKLIEAFEASTPIDHNPAWYSKNWLPTNAVNGPTAPVLKPGVVYGCLDKANKRFMLIGAGDSNIVIHIGNRVDTRQEIVAWCASDEVVAFLKETAGDIENSEVTYKRLLQILGTDDSPNLGQSYYDSKLAQDVPEVEQPINNEQKEEIKMNTTKTTAKNLSTWSVFFRTTGLALLIFAAITAIAFGLHFGAAYIAGMTASIYVTTVLKYLLAIVSGIATFFVANKGIDAMSDVIACRAPAVPEATPAAA